MLRAGRTDGTDVRTDSGDTICIKKKKKNQGICLLQLVHLNSLIRGLSIDFVASNVSLCKPDQTEWMCQLIPFLCVHSQTHLLLLFTGGN